MEKVSNYRMSIRLWVAHFITDALVAFCLSSIVITSVWFDGFPIWYSIMLMLWPVMIYNIIWFWWQIFIWHIFDTLKTEAQFFTLSKNLVLMSFICYAIAIILLSINTSLCVIFLWLWSCLFHVGWGNLSLANEKNTASHLWIFASGWVIWLSFWTWSSLYFPYAIFILLSILGFISYQLLIERNDKEIIPEIKQPNTFFSIKKPYLLYMILIGCIIFEIFRSWVWTYFQNAFQWWYLILAGLAGVSFLGKWLWGIFYDSKYFRHEYIFWIFMVSLGSIVWYINSQQLWLLFIWIFGLQFLLSPVAVILCKIVPESRWKIIGLTFWLSLVLGFISYEIFAIYFL